MIKIAKKVLPVVVAAALLGGCASDMGQKQTAGTVLGAVGGGLAGAQFGKGKGQLAATALGTLLGAYLGNEVGRSLDRADRQYLYEAESRAYEAPIGERIEWNNPDSGNYGSFTPTRDGYDRQTGAYCREFQTTIVVGGRQENAYGTACRQPDGSWKIVEQR